MSEAGQFDVDDFLDEGLTEAERRADLERTTGASARLIIDLQDKIQNEGTITGKEFDLPARQERKRSLVELPIIQAPMHMQQR